MKPSDILTILPIIVLVAWACLLLLVDLFIPRNRKGWTALLAAVGLAAALGVTVAQAGLEMAGFNGMVVLRLPAADGYRAR
jgi:NADH:ubiquinone oxidoreductase subunit 2 (subunit N)